MHEADDATASMNDSNVAYMPLDGHFLKQYWPPSYMYDHIYVLARQTRDTNQNIDPSTKHDV